MWRCVVVVVVAAVAAAAVVAALEVFLLVQFQTKLFSYKSPACFVNKN